MERKRRKLHEELRNYAELGAIDEEHIRADLWGNYSIMVKILG